MGRLVGSEQSAGITTQKRTMNSGREILRNLAEAEEERATTAKAEILEKKRCGHKVVGEDFDFYILNFKIPFLSGQNYYNIFSAKFGGPRIWQN